MNTGEVEIVPSTLQEETHRKTKQSFQIGKNTTLSIETREYFEGEPAYYLTVEMKNEDHRMFSVVDVDLISNLNEEARDKINGMDEFVQALRSAQATLKAWTFENLPEVFEEDDDF